MFGIVTKLAAEKLTDSGWSQAVLLLCMRCSYFSQDLDGEFVNQLVTKEDLREGRAQLLIDEDGNALVPRPEGVIDEEDDWEEMTQLEGLGQGGGCSNYLCYHVLLLAFAALNRNHHGVCCSEGGSGVLFLEPLVVYSELQFGQRVVWCGVARAMQWCRGLRGGLMRGVIERR
jgi:hypothetical protein